MVTATDHMVEAGSSISALATKRRPQPTEGIVLPTKLNYLEKIQYGIRSGSGLEDNINHVGDTYVYSSGSGVYVFKKDADEVLLESFNIYHPAYGFDNEGRIVVFDGRFHRFANPPVAYQSEIIEPLAEYRSVSSPKMQVTPEGKYLIASSMNKDIDGFVALVDPQNGQNVRLAESSGYIHAIQAVDNYILVSLRSDEKDYVQIYSKDGRLISRNTSFHTVPDKFVDAGDGIVFFHDRGGMVGAIDLRKSSEWKTNHRLLIDNKLTRIKSIAAGPDFSLIALREDGTVVAVNPGKPDNFLVTDERELLPKPVSPDKPAVNIQEIATSRQNPDRLVAVVSHMAKPNDFYYSDSALYTATLKHANPYALPQRPNIFYHR